MWVTCVNPVPSGLTMSMFPSRSRFWPRAKTIFVTSGDQAGWRPPSAVRSLVGVDDPRAAARQGGRPADRDVGAVREPARALAGVRRRLHEPLLRAVRVDEVHLRVAGRRVEPA